MFSYALALVSTFVLGGPLGEDRPLLNDYGLLPELAGFGAMTVIVVAATRGRLSFHDERRSQESNPADVPP